jgi:diguanylate cyclase (GGDEF)-like protein/PAS domain S-box-containing protein
MRTFSRSILLSCVAALVLWTGDAVIEAFIFQKGSLPELILFPASTHAVYTRLLIIIIILIVGIVLSRTVPKRDRVLEAFEESNETMLTITNAARDAIVLVNKQGTISFWNSAAERIFGYAAHEAIGRELHALLSPQRYRRTYHAGFRKFQSSGLDSTWGRALELKAVNKAGTEFPVEISLSALQLRGKWHAVGVLRDISGRKNSEEELRIHRERLEHLVRERTEELHEVNEILRKEIRDRARTEEELSRSENFLGTIFDSIHDPFSIVDRDYRIIRYNDAFLRMRNMRASDIIGKKCHEALYNRPGICEECIVDRTLQSKDPCAKEKELTLPDGSRAWVEIFTYPIFDQQRNVSHVIEYTRDISDRKKEEDEKKQLISTLNHLSTTDSLTGLLNRRALNEMLHHEIDRSSRYDNNLSLVLCDIDKFKKINDTFGHSAGDRALLAVAAVLRQTLRKSDLLGRYGGDEFMIILPETSLAGAKKLAEKVRQAVEELDIEVPGNKRIRFTLSMGVASCCSPIENIDTLVALADTALYASKEAGRNMVSTMSR